MNPFLPTTLILSLALIYSAGVLRQILWKKRIWNLWRLASFWFGTALIIFAVTPLHQNDHHTFYHHMQQHLLIGMVAPTFLVMAAPISLLLRNLPRRGAKACVQFLHSRIIRLWCHPITALILNFGGMLVLYLTPLYRSSLHQPWLHHFIHLHFLLAGYLFAWSMVGPDPAPSRPGFRARLSILLLAMAIHGISSKLMYIHLFPYATPHSQADIQAAAQLMYYGGDLAELLIAILLFAAWRKHIGQRAEASSYPASLAPGDP